MEDNKVPYIVYESEASRHERTVKRLLIALLLTIVLMAGTGNHVVTIISGDWYDSWDSGKEVPQYVWYRPSEDDRRED